MAKTIDKEVSASTKDLGKKSLDYMKKQYSENNLSSHIDNIDLRPYNEKYNNGFVISSGNDEVAVYKEFGTGIVGQGTGRLAGTSNYQYNVNSPFKGYYTDEMVKQYVATHKDKTEEQVKAEQTPNTWWYWKNGTWRYTEGMEGKNMYADLVDELNNNAGKHFRTAVSHSIGNYNGGK